MIEQLIQWDKELFLFLNGYHSDFWDIVMFYLSNKFVWIPLYVLFLYWLIKHYKKDAVWMILGVVVLITISDQLSVHGFKNTFMRLRPCHDPDLVNLVHIVREKCGGSFGFYSSHASNHFAIAVFMILALKSKLRFIGPVLFLWALVISYSRIYLGVHFPGDVIAGGMMGALLGYVIYVLVKTIIGQRSKLT